ncbi:chromosomal replication initiator DnaA [Rhizobiaceae bacterium]|nr:chromosomal replication initiator DnaA [Rhizobiaceae bacterium]
MVLALHAPLKQLRARTRCVAEVALARQIAMYLARTVFNLLEAEVGLHFKRDRMTAGQACRLVEDMRDDPVLDCALKQSEALLEGARTALGATAHAAHEMQIEPSNGARTLSR